MTEKHCWECVLETDGKPVTFTVDGAVLHAVHHVTCDEHDEIPSRGALLKVAEAARRILICATNTDMTFANVRSAVRDPFCPRDMTKPALEAYVRGDPNAVPINDPRNFEAGMRVTVEGPEGIAQGIVRERLESAGIREILPRTPAGKLALLDELRRDKDDDGNPMPALLNTAQYLELLGFPADTPITPIKVCPVAECPEDVAFLRSPPDDGAYELRFSTLVGPAPFWMKLKL